MFTALFSHCPCCYLQDHPQQRRGVTHDGSLLRKVVDEPWTAIGRLAFKQWWLRLWPGLVGQNASRAKTASLADTKGGKNLSEQLIRTKSAGNGAELCVDAPQVFCQ